MIDPLISGPVAGVGDDRGVAGLPYGVAGKEPENRHGHECFHLFTPLLVRSVRDAWIG